MKDNKQDLKKNKSTLSTWTKILTSKMSKLTNKFQAVLVRLVIRILMQLVLSFKNWIKYLSLNMISLKKSEKHEVSTHLPYHVSESLLCISRNELPHLSNKLILNPGASAQQKFISFSCYMAWWFGRGLLQSPENS